MRATHLNDYLDAQISAQALAAFKPAVPVTLEGAMWGLAGLALCAMVDRRFVAVPAIVGAAVFAHALTGWYPLLPIMRRLGIRSAREIARERYALKALRGDFAGMDSKSTDTLHGTARQDAPVEGQP